MPKKVESSPIKKWDGADLEALPLKHGLRVLRGNLVQVKEIGSQFGDSNVLVIDVDSTGTKAVGDDRQTWNMPARLDMLMANVRMGGTLLEIYLLGRERVTKNGKGYDFHVFELTGADDVVSPADLGIEPAAEPKPEPVKSGRK